MYSTVNVYSCMQALLYPIIHAVMNKIDNVSQLIYEKLQLHNVINTTEYITHKVIWNDV